MASNGNHPSDAGDRVSAESVEVVYAQPDGMPLTMRLVPPADSGTPLHPVVLALMDDDEPQRLGFLADRGFWVVLITRRRRDEALFPAHLHDLKAAVRWLRLHAEHYRIDPGRIGVLGQGEGAYLAVLLGITAHVAAFEGTNNPGPFSGVQAVVAVGGMVRPAYMPRDFSLLAHLREGSPPLLLLHGTADERVPIERSEWVHAAYLRANAGATLMPITGGDHSLGDHWSLVAHLTQGFLVRWLG